MKERIYFNDEFEKQLKDKTDQFKMYPSDKVWNDVHSSLHTRRRRFVVGMSALIGGFLLIAGSQLIFPSHPAQGNLAQSKISNSSKPATVADLHSFTGKDFITTPTDNLAEGQGPESSPNAKIPFIQRGVPSIQLSVSDQMTGTIPEKELATLGVKPLQPSDPKASTQMEESQNGADLNENIHSAQISPAVNTALEESASEKSTTQLSHGRSERLSWEIYITPTLNTHYLNGVNYQTIAQSLQSTPIMLVNVSNVNGFIDNTQMLGYNLGGNILYNLSKNISLKAGLEFSFNRYYIRAYNSGSPQTSVALNSYFGYVADSLNTSVQSTGTDKNPQHYQNRYYQLSLPVGVEMKVAGNGRVQLHVGASLQPSYLLNTDAYVLSKDYKGYIKDPQAFRRWNLNAGAEAYISYGVGNVRWELGPQVRYQFFSTYKNSYPLQENMLTYGIRIGISKTIR
jgi:Outer membrane protein beta-barrel domain